MNVQWNDLTKELAVLKDKLVIVEGKKDKEALKSFGITNVVTLKKSLFEVVEEVSSKAKECVILTDLDKKGKYLYSRLRQDLQKHGVKVDNSFRNFLFRETKLRQIEGLSGINQLH